MNAREWFTHAAEGFRAVLPAITDETLIQAGLGEWDVRALLGHTCRAFLTLESYLDSEPVSPVDITSTAEYFRVAAAGTTDQAAIAQRGRDAGQSLGEHPVATAREIADRVTQLIAGVPDDATFGTPFGRMDLATYLPSRAFELTVHGVDLARAVGSPVPRHLLESTGAALDLTVRIADEQARLTLLMAITGREALPSGFTVL